jgi:hypothetical protein
MHYHIGSSPRPPRSHPAWPTLILRNFARADAGDNPQWSNRLAELIEDALIHEQ